MSKIISFALAIVAIMAVGCASTKLTKEEWENMSPAERDLYAIEQLEKRRSMKEFERSYKERMRQNQLDRIERNLIRNNRFMEGFPWFYGKMK